MCLADWCDSLYRVIKSHLINVTLIKRASKKLLFHNESYLGVTWIITCWVCGLSAWMDRKHLAVLRPVLSHVVITLRGSRPFKKWVGGGLARQSPSQLTWSWGTLNPAILSSYCVRQKTTRSNHRGGKHHTNHELIIVISRMMSFRVHQQSAVLKSMVSYASLIPTKQGFTETILDE